MTKASDFSGFPRRCTTFLRQLEKNNNRDWFNEHKAEYEDRVREPALAFIAAMSGPLRRLSPHFLAVPRKTGGSLMRVYRDTRFSKDKTPYKTNIGIQFRHALGKDVHAPGFYVHIEPAQVFLGVGIWRPEPKALTGVREFIMDNPASWRQVTRGGRFRRHFRLVGESLVRPPRGVSPDHELLEDLKRKDFLALHDCRVADIHDAGFPQQVLQRFRDARPFMKYLCDALEVPF